MKSFITLIIILLVCESRQEIKAQQSVLFEAGPSYFSNNLPDNYTHLYDFIVFTFNTRILFAEKTNSAFSIEVPLSVRSHFAGEIMNRFSLQVPLYLTYNIGAGASGNSSEKKAGYLAGIGWGYFYQQAFAKQIEQPQYKESISITGPEAELGLRFALRKIDLFKVNKKIVHPSVTIRISHLFNLKDSNHDIGSVSALAGFAF